MNTPPHNSNHTPDPRRDDRSIDPLVSHAATRSEVPASDAALDRSMDEMLRALGPSLELPGEPSADDLRRWTAHHPGEAPQEQAAHADVPAPLPLRRAVGVRGGWRRYVPLATAAAGVLAAGTVLLTLGRGGTAGAATIMQSLRDKSFWGMHVKLTHLGSQGYDINGEASFRFDRAVTASQLLDSAAPAADASAAVEVSQMYASLLVKGSPAAPLANLTAHVSAAASPTSGWVYVQSDTPEVLARVVGPAAEVTRKGILFDLDALIKNAHSTHHASNSITFSNQNDFSIPSVFAARLRPLLRGEASAAQLEQFAKLAAGDDANVTSTARVTSEGGGLYLLTIPIPDYDVQLPSGTLSISYQDGVGLRWIELTGLDGNPASCVHIEPFNDAIPSELVDRSNLHAGTTIDAGGSLLGLFGEGRK